MTRSEFSNVWKAHDFSAIGWWWWPLGFLIVLINCVTCFIGLHEYDDFHPEGTRCGWCGKQRAGS